jgi:hypothetical protein
LSLPSMIPASIIFQDEPDILFFIHCSMGNPVLLKPSGAGPLFHPTT